MYKSIVTITGKLNVCNDTIYIDNTDDQQTSGFTILQYDTSRQKKNNITYKTKLKCSINL